MSFFGQQAFDFGDLPKVELPGSETYWSSWDIAEELEKLFPGQDCFDFASAMEYNPYPQEIEGTQIVDLKCTQFGYNDSEDWIWEVKFSNDTHYVVTGGCDYTGWDCQSSTSWTKIR